MSGKEANLLEKYEASMVLHGVGDAMGYKNGEWEFNYSGQDIHDQLARLGGLENLKIDQYNWMVSDDTVLHLANANCLVKFKDVSPSSTTLYQHLVRYYKQAMGNMKGRAPGGTCIQGVNMLSDSTKFGFRLPYNPKGAGCGVSMRSSCIGLRFSKPEQLLDLVAFSIESGRMTHHHPLGYLGGLAAALFVSYAIQDKPAKSWGARFLVDLEQAREYIKNSEYFVEENLADWNRFVEPWKKYLKARNIETGENQPTLPAVYDVQEREVFYKTVSGFGNWPGALGIDSVLIAYDALLGCGGDWRELCLRAMLHGGDNDSTGCLAGSWYGALYGFKNVPANHYKELEYLDEMKSCGKKFYEIQYAK